jgi:hypothetical protein
MSDIGFKIAKAGTTTASTNINDYIYWTKYPPMALMGQAISTVTISGTNYLGTTSVNHGFGFAPLTLASIEHTDNSERYFVPISDWTDTINCPLDDFDESTVPKPSFSYTVGSTSVDIVYNVMCYTQYQGGGGPFPPIGTDVFKIYLSYYMWKLGSSFSI